MIHTGTVEVEGMITGDLTTDNLQTLADLKIYGDLDVYSSTDSGVDASGHIRGFHGDSTTNSSWELSARDKSLQINGGSVSSKAVTSGKVTTKPEVGKVTINNALNVTESNTSPGDITVSSDVRVGGKQVVRMNDNVSIKMMPGPIPKCNGNNVACFLANKVREESEHYKYYLSDDYCDNRGGGTWKHINWCTKENAIANTYKDYSAARGFFSEDEIRQQMASNGISQSNINAFFAGDPVAKKMNMQIVPAGSTS